ncbi:hypothetical protein [Micromonospora sp. KC721]|uniref:hypothetical protein n=1 Tax=Micromonospora sp. KC721 TaxID=2530380 RepID=UPI0010450C3A|nr:hypothetical protein [Micromonospora sp. KC721]TDB81626.1 hypothetical protein E1182_04585 [Micromonospora sp. KC721]
MVWADQDALAVLATATVTGGDEPDRHRGASFYADPVAWLVADAVGAVFDAAGQSGKGTGTDVGVLAVSEYGTSHTMREVTAMRDRGRVSPLRFAGANPGSVAGLACIVHGLRGPSLMLSMPPPAARPTVALLARAWLTGGVCRRVVVSEHERGPAGHTVRTVVLTSAEARC